MNSSNAATGSFNPLIHDGHTYDFFYVIENKDINAGYVALIIYALNGVRRALAQNALPVIVFGEKDTPFFYEASKGKSIWEYYFEPVSPVSYQQLKQWQQEGLVSDDLIHVNTREEAFDGHLHDEERLATYWAWKEPEDKVAWMEKKRAQGRAFVRRHLTVKPEFEQFADDFTKLHFTADYIIGVHARGTDFGYSDPVPLQKFFDRIDQKVKEPGRSKFQIFLATDQTQFVREFEDRYPGLIITTDALRSSNHIAPFKKSGGSAFQKGADVLIDMILLARCDYILKGAAAVGEFALWLTDDDQEFHDFSHECEFKNVKYHGIKSAYLTLNIKNKSKLGLMIQDRWETFNRFFYYVPFTRAIYHRFKWVRNIFKH